MAWMIGGRLENKPDLFWSLKDRHTLKAERKRKDILEHGGKINKSNYGYGKECMLNSGDYEHWNHLGSF